MAKKPISNYKAFWPYYVSQHRNKTNRNLHFLGTALTLLALFESITQLNPWFLLLLPVAYIFAWVGHFFIEKNRPTSYSYPLWGFRAAVQMFFLMCALRMEREIGRVDILQSDSAI